MPLYKANLKNVRVDNAFKDLNVTEALKPEEYKLVVDEVVKKAKDLKPKETMPTMWDAPSLKSSIILGKIAENSEFRKYDGTDGPFWSISFILLDERWASFTVNKESDKNDFDGCRGCKIAVVGRLTEKVGKEEGKSFWNVKKYRGAVLLDAEPLGKSGVSHSSDEDGAPDVLESVQ